MSEKTILIGQRKNIELINSAFTSLRKGKGGFVCVSGEPGHGKTYVLQAALANASHSDSEITPVYVECQAPIGNFNVANIQPLDPFSRAIKHLMENKSTSAKKRLAKNLGLTALSIIPVLGDLFYGIKEAGRDWRQYKKDVASADIGKAKNITADYYDSLFLVIEEKPTVIFFDDFHWADAQSIELISMLMDKTEDFPLLIVLSYKKSVMVSQGLPLNAFISQIENGYKGVDFISLKPFMQEEIGEYCIKSFDKYIPNQKFEHWLYDKTYGVQGVVAEYLRYFNQYPPFKPDGSLIDNFDDNDYIPSSLQALFAQELEEITDDEKNLLSICSSEGKIFTATVVAQLLNSDVLSTIKSLRQLQNKTGIIKSMGARKRYGIKTTTYKFTQVFYHSYFEDSLEYEEYVALHGQIASFLKQKYEETENDSLKEQIAPYLAAHSSEAGDDDTAKSMILASAKNSKKYGNDDILKNTLENLQNLHFLNAKTEEEQENKALEIQEIISEGMDVSTGNGGLGDTVEDFHSIRRQIVHLYHNERYSEASARAIKYYDGNIKSLRHTEKVQMLCLIAKIMMDDEQFEDAEEYVIRSLDYIKTSADPQSTCLAMNTAAIYYSNMGRVREASNYLEMAAEKSLELPPELRLLTLANIALTYHEIEPEKAKTFYESARRLSSSINFTEFSNDLLGAFT